jgi:hypothetical protein
MGRSRVQSLKPLIVSALAALAVGGGQAAQRPSEGPLTAQTQPISPSVLATIVTRNPVLELVVLWRGEPGWFLAGSGRGAKYSGGNGSFTADLDYGGLQLGLSYDASRRTARVLAKAVSLPEHANVILVDSVDRGAAQTIAGTASVDSHLEGNSTFASVLGSSPEIVSFLRCDAETPNGDANRKIRSFMCDDLKK